jgi:hypothetical protein
MSSTTYLQSIPAISSKGTLPKKDDSDLLQLLSHRGHNYNPVNFLLLSRFLVLRMSFRSIRKKTLCLC